MATRRLHLTGASGSGTTTLGQALSRRLAVPHYDTDSFYFYPTEIPFEQKRPPEDRVRLMMELFAPSSAWVLSGSIGDWADSIAALFDLIVYLDVPTDERLKRIEAREIARYGASAVASGGWRHAESEYFKQWAGGYETGALGGRSRARHQAWLARQSCPVLYVDGTRGLDELVEKVSSHFPA
jgi:adenylate kinase family enzyme